MGQGLDPPSAYIDRCARLWGLYAVHSILGSRMSAIGSCRDCADFRLSPPATRVRKRKAPSPMAPAGLRTDLLYVLPCSVSASRSCARTENEELAAGGATRVRQKTSLLVSRANQLQSSRALQRELSEKTLRSAQHVAQSPLSCGPPAGGRI